MNWDIVQSFCISISVVGAAVTYIYKAAIAAKKPSDTIKGRFDEIDRKLNNDDSKLKKYATEMEYISKSVQILMRSNLVILGHMSDGNNTGEMAKMEKEIQDFLISN